MEVHCQCGRATPVFASAGRKAIRCVCGRALRVPASIELTNHESRPAYTEESTPTWRDELNGCELALVCEMCRVEAATKEVVFHMEIGAFILRFPHAVAGRLCKTCIHRHFKAYTLITLFLGWWSLISVFVTPFVLVNNVVRYLFCLGLEPVSANATPPELTKEAIEKIKPCVDQLLNRLHDGEHPLQAARQIAHRTGVTPGQVILYIRSQS